MPTPIGHALGGLIAGLLTLRRAQRPGTRPVPGTPYPVPGTPVPAADLVLCAAAACLPDIDFFWGRHNQETHSVGFALIVGLAVFAWRRSPRLALACTFAVATHVLFDWLGSDDFPPLGVMALWPFTREYYFADAFVFEAISRRYHLPGFFMHNFLAVLRETAMLTPIAAAAWWWRMRRARSA